MVVDTREIRVRNLCPLTTLHIAASRWGPSHGAATAQATTRDTEELAPEFVIAPALAANGAAR